MTHPHETPDRIEHLALADIRPNPHQPRRYMDEAALGELAASITQHGLLQPIFVRSNGAFYELVAGERRLRAARLAGLTHIPALVKETGEQASAVLALVENLQREDLHFLEEAEGYLNLAQEHSLTQEEIAGRVGKSQSGVANKMRLMRLGRALRAELAQAGLTERHARALLRLPEELMQRKALGHIIHRQLNVRQAEDLIDGMLQKRAQANGGIQVNAQVNDEMQRNAQASDGMRKTPQGDGAAQDSADDTLQKDPQPANRRLTHLMRDYRLLAGSLKTAVRSFQAAGLPADYTEEDCGEYVTVTVMLPKRSVKAG